MSGFSSRPKVPFILASYGAGVRLRPPSTTSERELLQALAAGGRRVSLEELAKWRKDGLLPPLASHGGKGAGRCYYWREPVIQAQAETVHDALLRQGGDGAALSLWLRGFDVALPLLRRSWLHRGKRNGAARIRQAPGKTRIKAPAAGLSDLLLSACRAAAGAVESPAGSMKPALAVMERALAGLGWSGEKREMEAHWRMLAALMLVLGASDAISAASDDELREARGHLGGALALLSEFRGAESQDSVIDTLGPPIFLFLVTLLRSGQRELLESVMDHVAIARRERAAAHVYQPEAGIFLQ